MWDHELLIRFGISLMTFQHRPSSRHAAAPADLPDEVWPESEDELGDGDAIAWRLTLRHMPAWLVSLLVHLALLLVLALSKFAEDRTHGIYVTAELIELAEEFVENWDLELEALPPLPVESFAGDAAIPDVGVLALGDLTLAAELAGRDPWGELPIPQTTLDEIGLLFGADGAGMADIGDGLKAASFFGARSRGERFVFVVDNSNSMIRGRFETALLELIRTVDSMTPEQQFYVIFFSDTAYRMFHPAPAPGLVPATEPNKRRLKTWLSTVQLCFHTEGREAVTAALAMNPDAIYILGDGVFTDDTTELLTAPHDRRITIHTLGMEVQPRGEVQLRAIASANRGTYRAVSASPLAREMALQNPLPRNRTRGPVWGQTLPDRQEPKKKKEAKKNKR